MILVAQRVSEAKVVVDHQTIAAIDTGLMVLACAEVDDDPTRTEFILASKLVKLRIFPDADGKMNLSLLDIPDSKLLLVPQFTLAADCRKGNRPNFMKAARPGPGLTLFNAFKSHCERLINTDMNPNRVQQGEFGAHMNVSLCNAGPTTLILQDKDFT